MTDQSNKPELTPADKRRMRILLNISGFAFLLAAGFIVSSPDTVEQLFGLDKETQNLLSIALTVVAFMDFFIARFLFGKKDTL